MKILKQFIKWLLLVCAAICLVLLGLWLLNSPEGLADNSQSKARLERADYSVKKTVLEIVDSTRTTPALGGFAGDDKRVLKGAIWFPEEKSTTQSDQKTEFPLVIYSHGFAGEHKESTHIAEYLASNGYVVAAVNFPLSNMRSPAEVPQLLDIVNQPSDVSAVIDHLISLNDDSNSPLHQRIDTNNIGAMGLSLGGLTTALAAFHPDFNDRRIKAAVMMAPPLEAFSEQFYASNLKVKSLLISGSLDRVVPEITNATQVMSRHPNGWFISLDKGTHLGFANIGNPLRWVENPDDLGCALMDMMLAKQKLPERWDAVIANTGGELRDIVVAPPCPELPGASMNGLEQQWLTRIAIGAFFDMHLHTGTRAKMANEFFTEKLSSENPALTLTSPP